MDVPQIHSLADGVTLYAVQSGLFKTCKIHISMALPLTGDIAARAALPYVLRRCCRKYPDFTSLNRRLDDLYGAALGAAVQKKGEAQVLQLSVTAIDDRFATDGGSISAETAQLLADLLFDPKLENGMFTESDVQTEKRLLLERKHAEDDDKGVYARRRCQEVMCETEAFARNRYGEDDEIASLTPQRIAAAWHEALEQAVIRIVLVSSDTGEAVRKLFCEKFAGVARRTAQIRTQFVPAPAGDVRTVRETQPLMQGTLVLGFRCGMTRSDDMDPAMLVMNDMFGGGVYSKLFTVVREKMSLCYYCRSILNRDKGIIIAASGIETENEEKAKAAILDQLHDMQQGNLDRETFDAAIRSLSDTIRGYTDSPDMLCAWYAEQIFREKTVTPAQRIEAIRSVRFEDIQAAAQQVQPDAVFMLAGTGGNDHA